ncbi:hypothetical protein L208DRAFT_1510322 [Tricholoma matsutake]|nr:hypothetical protein L208DRAFT_1510322 [Tricholoma matsutake 945]
MGWNPSRRRSEGWIAQLNAVCPTKGATIAEPELLYGPEAAYEKGSMDGKGWDRPEAIYAIQALAPTLPHLHGTLVAFLEGAVETWEWFSSEYEPGGEIANALELQRQNA